MAAAAVAANKSNQAAAASISNGNNSTVPPPAKLVLLDPKLLMAARRGDSQRLKELLRLNNSIEEELEPPAVILEVAPDDDDEALDDGASTAEGGTTLLHVVAESGDSPEFIRCAKMIITGRKNDQESPSAASSTTAARRRARALTLRARDRNGDTPLHRAAAAGNAKMIACLIHLTIIAADDDDDDDDDEASSVLKLVRTENDSGETALHQAIRAANNKVACIDSLMDMDSELACIPSQHAGAGAASPLYLAISLGEVEIARHLYRKSRGKLSYSGPGGCNVLHAAVHRGQAAALPMVLEWLKKEPLMTTGDGGHTRVLHHHHHLLSQLTSQRDKENGSTPLHLAASMAGLPSPACMSETHPHFWGWSRSPARLLLEANESTAYQPDKRGLYPIHVAAGAGSLRVVKMLLERCPECATLRDANKGRTFLHVAVEEGCFNVVRYVCYHSQRKLHRAAGLLSSVLNMQDDKGNTPLHRAVRAGNLTIFSRLVRNRRVRLDVLNNKGMTPIDVAWSKMPLEVYYAWDPRIHIRKYLLKVGAPYGESRGDLFHQKHILPQQDEDKMSANVTAAAQVLCIFSVLITTVTFASAFTLPGGYRSAGDGGGGGVVAGTPVLAGYAFDAFLLSDALAFLCSLYATSLLLYAGVPVGTLVGRLASINAAYTLMWHAGRSLVAAFALGLYVVLLPDDRTIANAIGVLMVISVYGFVKGSEGIDSMMIVTARSQRMRSIWGTMLALIANFLDRFWSYIIIFGLPAIRKWARLH